MIASMIVATLSVLKSVLTTVMTCGMTLFLSGVDLLVTPHNQNKTQFNRNVQPHQALTKRFANTLFAVALYVVKGEL